MEYDELIQTYFDDAYNRMTITTLLSHFDGTGLNSNTYHFTVDDGDTSYSKVVMDFDNFMSEFSVLDGGDHAPCRHQVPEGEEAVVSSDPRDTVSAVAHYVYDQFTDHAMHANYWDEGYGAVDNAIEIYRGAAHHSPTRIVVGDEMLTDDEIDGLESQYTVSIDKSHYLPLEDEILLSVPDKVGYYGVRTEPDVGTYIDAWEEDDVNLDSPLVAQAYLRAGVAITRPKYALHLTAE